MATFLYRLGRFSFRRRAVVAALWGAVLIAALAGATTLSGPTSDAFRIPGTPSQQAIDLLQERFPQVSADGATARVVFAVPDGQRLTSTAHRTAVESAVAELEQAPQVASVSDPFAAGAISPDGTVGLAQASYRVQSAEISDPARAALTAVVDHARAQGLTAARHRDQCRRDHRGERFRRPVVDHAHPRADARPRGGHRLRPVHRLAVPARTRLGA